MEFDVGGFETGGADGAPGDAFVRGVGEDGVLGGELADDGEKAVVGEADEVKVGVVAVGGGGDDGWGGVVVAVRTGDGDAGLPAGVAAEGAEASPEVAVVGDGVRV